MSRAIVVTLRAPGFLWRVAEQPITISGIADGTPTLAEARLIDADDLTRAIDAFSLERADFDRCRLVVAMPDDFGSASVDAGFAHLAHSIVEVATYREGDPWARRRVWIGYGVVSGLALDVVNAAISFTAEASGPAISQSAVDGSRDMGTAFQALGFPRLTGKLWPTVIGAVKRIPAHKIGAVATGGGTGAGFYGLAICGHHIGDTGQAFLVREDGADYTPTGTMSLRNTYDDNGDPCCIVASTDSADFTADQGSFTVDLPGGGVESVRGGSAAALRADGVIAYLLAQSGIPVDWSSMDGAIQMVRGYDVGVYCDGPVDYLQALRERVLTVVPLVEDTTLSGFGLRYVSPRDAPTMAHLEEGPTLIGFTGALVQQSDPDEVCNSFRVWFDYDHSTGSYLQSVVVDGDTHPLCAATRTLIAAAEGGDGVRACADVELDAVWDFATAAQKAQDLADRLGAHRYGIGALLSPDMDHLMEGDRVTVTSHSLGWTARPCVLAQRTERVDPLTVVLVPIPEPVTTAWGG